MKNFMGEEVSDEPVPLTFDFTEVCHIMTVHKGKEYVGQVDANGWTGRQKIIGQPLGEPILTNWQSLALISFTEMSAIMRAWYEFTTPERTLEFVNQQIAKEKAKQTNITKTIKLSGNMVSGDQCDMSGHPNPNY